ncbi:MAG: FlgD immunoglobulin-like domain containing protein, partial [Chitinophagaceae bacterium]
SPGRFGSDPVCVQTGTLGNGAEYNFQFKVEDTAIRRRMVNFLDSIPDGYYVIVRNLMETNYPATAYASNWKNDQLFLGNGNSIYHRLKDQGFQDIDSFNRNRVFAFIYKKNDPVGFAPRSAFSAGMYDQLFYSVDLPSMDTMAFLTSPKFGPALQWRELIWRGVHEMPLNEQVSLSVVGIKNDGSSSVLLNSISPSQITTSLTSIDARVYPFMQLKLNTSDTSRLTPLQLKHWRVLYQPVPEGALAPNQFLSVKDTVELGEPWVYKIAFRNTSEAAFDSLRIKMIVTDRNNVSHTIVLPKKRPLSIGDSLHIGATLNTAVYPGMNTIFLEANPDNDQPEQFHFNNFAYKNLFVKPDSTDPLLDVTFDGIHILNRDVVSSKPAILIQVRDESKWMLLNDTSLFTVQVRYPSGVSRPYYFNTDTLRLIPSQQTGGADNQASLQFTPYFTEDGVYELVVTAKDRSGNKAGELAYRVQFEVINRPMISNLLNYPNPFTSSTAFVFTLTGQQIPQQLKIEILTITGKVVREITKAELGPLRIGRNITEFKWDGTDQFGQPLANGIYLYRVVTRLDGQEMEKYRASGDRTDSFFNKGYGKMYLLR